MPASPNLPPLRYDPSFEIVTDDEQRTTEAIAATMRKISDTTFRDYGHAVRSVHAKSHGILKCELRVLDGLVETLAQGIFAKPATYPVVMRISTIPGDVLDDSISVPRGLAVKVIGVEGERLSGSEDAATQDFLMVNAPAFAAPTPKGFLGNLKLLAATTDRAPGLKKAASAVLQTLEATIEAFGRESGIIKTLGGHPPTNPLSETYYSQVPILYGPYMVKVSIVPVSPELLALKDKKIAMSGRPNALREEVVDFFKTKGAEWEVRVQFCHDLQTMPIEDAAVVWPEDKSPYIAVARIVAPPQDAWTDARASAVDDGLSFSPWHGIAAHRPLGAVMRSRKMAYEMGRQFRAGHNHKTIDEPRSANDVALG